MNNTSIFISAIYASTSNINRKSLWLKLNTLQNNYDVPWLFIGDFNTIMGAHEHSGSFTPAKPPIEDFQQWSDTFNLIHLLTRGAAFTWDNRRSGLRHTKRMLDRSIVNHKLLDLCSSISCSTLTKTCSDHYPLLLDFNTDPRTFASSFKFIKMWTLHTDWTQLITDCWSVNVVGSPMFVLSHKLKHLKSKLKHWNKDVFGNIHAYVDEAEAKLAEIQNQINIHGHSDTLLTEEKIAQADLDQALNKQDLF